MKILVAFGLGLPLVLAACSTTQDRCLAEAAPEVLANNAEIADVQGALDLGYRYAREHRQYSKKVRTPYASYSLDRYRTVTVRNDIDPAEEQARLDALLVRREELRQTQDAAIQRCQAAT